MGIWSSLDPASASVEPGGAESVTLRLRNTTDLVEEYRIAVAGEPAVWAGVEPRTLRLYPGTTGTAEITFRPPRSPDATAGGHPFAVEVVPTEQPGDKTVVEGHLTVAPFTEVRAELLPHTVRGRFGGKPRFAVDNLGNTRLTASLTGKDNGGQLGFELHPANVQVEPGRAAWVRGRIRPGGIAWFGQHESHPYKVNVLRSGMEPVEVEGVFVQHAVMPRWLLGVMTLLLVCTIAFTIAWFTFKPDVKSRARSGATVPAGAPLSLPTEQESPEPTKTPEKKEAEKKPQRKPKTPEKSRLPQGPNFSTVTRLLIKNVMTGQCADVDESGNGVLQNRCDKSSGSNQFWDLVITEKKAGPGGADLFIIRNFKDSLCLDPPGREAVPKATELVRGPCRPGTSDDNQMWYLEMKSEKRFWIRSHSSNGLCLDVSELHGTGGPGAALTLFTCDLEDDHLWSFR